MAKKKKGTLFGKPKGKVIKHPGALKEKAQSVGETTAQYADQHKGDSGKTGEQARLAIILMGMRPKRKMPKSEMKTLYQQKGARAKK